MELTPEETSQTLGWHKLTHAVDIQPYLCYEHFYVCVCLCEPYAYLGVESCASVVIPGQEAEVCLLVKLPKKWGLETLAGVYLLKLNRFDAQVSVRETEKGFPAPVAHLHE